MYQTLKEAMKSKPESDPGYLFKTNLDYPTIEGNTSNFIEDYQYNHVYYNKYALLKRGSQGFDYDEDLYESAWDALQEAAHTITDVNLENWARLYYALSLSYNPLYNVDGETIRQTTQKQRTDLYGAQSGSSTFGATSMTDSYGAVSKTDQYGNKSETLGAHTDTQTNSSVSFDSGLEKETGQTQNSMGSQTNTEAAYTDTHSELAKSDTHTGAARNDSHSENEHTDTHTDAAFTETETRRGNIGVTMSQQLLDAEWEFRKRSFFEHIIYQLLDDIGFYYKGGIGL